MFQITRTYEFSAAHRIKGHPKCGRMHGHNYTVEVAITSHGLNLDGMVLDYSKMDEWIKPIIDKMDHRYLLSIKEMGPDYDLETIDADTFDLEEQHSTAECIAHRLFWMIRGKRPSTVEVLWVRVWETPKSSAVYTPSDRDFGKHEDWPRSGKYVSDTDARQERMFDE